MLTACGGGGSTATAPTAQAQDLSAADYFPLQIGNRWIYQSSDSNAPVTVRLTGSTTIQGVSGTIEQSDDPNDNQSSVLVADAEGVRQYPSADADPLTAAVGAVQLLRNPLRVGDSFVASDKAVSAVADIDGDGVADAATIHAETKVLSLESVTTPVATFADCIHLQTTSTIVVQSSVQKQSVTITTVDDEWLAPGIGPVRSVSVSTGNGTSTSTTESITAFGVGAKRSESVPPTATATALSGTTPLGPHATIDIAFSEDMDTTTLAGAFQVVDAAGRPVPGTTTLDARSLHFAPSGAWAGGAYNAGFNTAATDLVGNPLAGTVSWPFSVDATPPSVLSSQPMQGAVDVPLASSIVITFSEAVDPATVSAATLTLLVNNGQEYTPLSYQTAGAVVTLTPLQPLVRGTSYQLGQNGVADLAGNAAVATRIQFNTDPGRFGTGPRLVADGAATGYFSAPIVAVGDLNGDGRPDVVSAANYDTGNGGVAARVIMFLQQSDGTLGAGILLSTTTNICLPTSLAIADFDGNGRNELVIGRRPSVCTAALVRVAADGSYATDTVEPPAHGLMKAADLYGDGHSELITFFDGDLVTRIWRLDTAGWSLNDTLQIDTTSLTVGDVDGDGHPDIALIPNGLAEAAELWTQGAGGHFGLQQALHTFRDGLSYDGSLSIADVDGDGRNDVVLGNIDNIYVFKSTGAGSFAPPQTPLTSPTYDPTPVVAADVNGDGRPDLVYANGSLHVMLQNVDGTFGSPNSYPSGDDYQPDASALFVTDLNGDGRQDVILNGRLYLQRAVPVMSASTGRSKSAGSMWARRASKAVRAGIH